MNDSSIAHLRPRPHAPKPAWELTVEQRRLLKPREISEAEAAFVYDLNRGRRMLALDPAGAYTYGKVEIYDSEEVGTQLEEQGDCLIYDAIAALLAVGIVAGYSPRELCEAAIEQVDSVLNNIPGELERVRGSRSADSTQRAGRDVSGGRP